MNENLYYIGLTSITEFLILHDAGKPLFYTIGQQETVGLSKAAPTLASLFCELSIN